MTGYWARVAAARGEVQAVHSAMDAEDERRAAGGQVCVEDERFWELNERSEQAAAALRAAWLGRDTPSVRAEQTVAGAHEAVEGAIAHSEAEQARQAPRPADEDAAERGDDTERGCSGDGDDGGQGL